MNRLVYSNGAYLRSMQITGAQLFAFVEGGLDRPFVERLLKSIDPQIRHRIVAAKELPGSTGGKNRVIEWFKGLRDKKMLASQVWGKKFFAIFFLDKDADDFKNKLLRSDHVAYTTTYDLEGMIFNCTDFHSGLADAALITLDQAKELMPSFEDWLKSIAQNWIDWVTLCLLTNFEGVNCGCGFDRLSEVNPDRLGSPDIIKIEQYKQIARQKLGIPVQEFSALYEKYRKRVDATHKRGQHLRYFKGKWLHSLLQLHCERAKKVEDWNVRSIGEKLTIALLGQIGNSQRCACCAPFHARLQLGLEFVSA